MSDNNGIYNRDLERINRRKNFMKNMKVTLITAISTIAVVLLVLWTLTGIFSFHKIKVSGDSMYPNLLNNEGVYTYKVPKWYPKAINPMPNGEYQRGEVVVFNANNVDPREQQHNMYYVKRIIGKPGDTVSFKNNKLYVNNKAINQNFISHSEATTGSNGPQGQKSWDIKSLATNTSSPESVWNAQSNKLLRTTNFVIPSHMYFVMGDHRSVSNDSRYYGLVSDNDILGIVHVNVSHNKDKVNNVRF